MTRIRIWLGSIADAFRTGVAQGDTDALNRSRRRK